MEVARTMDEGVLRLKVSGRIDGYWADHLDSALGDAVGEGYHRIALDCSDVAFLSSAGIGVLVKRHKELTRIHGRFQVVHASAAVASVLRITRLADLLIGEVESLGALTTSFRPARYAEAEGLALEAYDLDPPGRLTCRAIGTSAPLASGTFAEANCACLDGMTPAFAIGVGAFGESFADCRARFGELISVAGATAYLPADGTNAPDYLVAKGPLSRDIRLLYGLAFDGGFAHLVRFASLRDEAVKLSQLAAAALTVAKTDRVGIVIAAETAGVVGASLRRSPAETPVGGDFFAHPSIRTRLSFTAERAFAHSVTLTAGMVRRGRAGSIEQVRPLGDGLHGHLHAAAFRFRPLQKGSIELVETVTRLFDDQVLGVMHLLHDDRDGRETEFVRGACWIAPVAE